MKNGAAAAAVRLAWDPLPPFHAVTDAAEDS